MNPASSIIIFTVLSGYGFGALFWLGLGFHPESAMSLQLIAVVSFLITIGGLVSSTFHLGNPQRAFLAFTQWRSSWLSREAILAVAALLVSFLYLSALSFFNLRILFLGELTALICFLTIFSTSMIYAQMKTVPRWNMKSTPVLFLLYGLAGSSIIVMNYRLSAILFALLGFIQVFSWLNGDGRFEKISHIGTATQLSDSKHKVRMLEPPHTGSNYLLKEMVHIVAQKHIRVLRWLSLICASAIPSLTLLISSLLISEIFLVMLTVGVFNIFGTFVARWLFFFRSRTCGWTLL